MRCVGMQGVRASGDGCVRPGSAPKGVVERGKLSERGRRPATKPPRAQPPRPGDADAGHGRAPRASCDWPGDRRRTRLAGVGPGRPGIDLEFARASRTSAGDGWLPRVSPAFLVGPWSFIIFPCPPQACLLLPSCCSFCSPASRSPYPSDTAPTPTTTASMLSSTVLVLLVLPMLASLYFAWTFLMLVLRQARSPLRHLPGPPSPSFFMGNLREMHDQENNGLVARWTAEHGSTFVYRGFIGGCRLMTTDPRAVNYIMSRGYDYPKPDFVRDSLASMVAGYEGLLTAEGEMHRKQVCHRARYVRLMHATEPARRRVRVRLDVHSGRYW